ncbi:protein S100-A4-like [Aquila chrysaetos chrysaetos]|nr:protein S100-A4-like [Aquila chrysaetos chrysaetos]
MRCGRNCQCGAAGKAWRRGGCMGHAGQCHPGRAINARCAPDAAPWLLAVAWSAPTLVHRRLAMACPLEQALAVMVTTFHKYSGKEGDKYKLSKAELKELLNKELPIFGSKQMDEVEFKRLVNDLDHNKDSEVDFKEYACFLACITMGFNEFFKDGPTKQPRKK